MKKVILGILAVALSTGIASAQKGEQFPALTGKTLTNKTITVPTDTKGKYTLIGMAYSKKSEESLQGWFQPVYTTFLDKSESMWSTGEDGYDVNIYFIPMLSGIKEMAASTVEKKLKEGVDKELHPYVLLYAGGLDVYKKQLKFDGKDKAYFFVLDDKGKIVYSTSGDYNDKKLDEIETILNKE